LVEDPVTMFEAVVLLSFHRRLRSDGVAAAMQSGGACTLFAEAAGAQGLSLPELARPTMSALRKALPHFASQNNPLDVTGQAAVETEMFGAALEALASDPAIGFVAFDADPPRAEEEGSWADPLLRRVRDLQRGSGVAFASVGMSALAYGPAARRFVDRAGIPFLQGHRASAGAIRALVDLQGARDRRRRPLTRRRALRSAGAVGHSTRPRAGCSSCTASGVLGSPSRGRRWLRPRLRVRSASRWS
jgi:acyl-CoA synthetase (NDP forming)